MVLICLLGKFSEKLNERGGVVVLICLLGTFSGKWVIEATEFNFEAVSNLQGNLEAQIGHKLNRMILDPNRRTRLLQATWHRCQSPL